jgi:hypothetical protein
VELSRWQAYAWPPSASLVRSWIPAVEELLARRDG